MHPVHRTNGYLEASRAGTADVARTVTLSDGREVSEQQIEKALELWDELLNPEEMVS